MLIIQLHLALEDAMPLHAAHQVGLKVEARIRGAFPESDILIHFDPVSLGEEDSIPSRAQPV